MLYSRHKHHTKNLNLSRVSMFILKVSSSLLSSTKTSLLTIFLQITTNKKHLNDDVVV